MRRFSALFIAAALLLTSLTACRSQNTQALHLEGDAKPFIFTGRSYDLAYYFEHHVETRADAFDLLFIAHDGFAVRLSDLDGVTLMNSHNSWELRAPNHPPSANITMIAHMIVISISEDAHAMRLIDAEQQVRELTAGQLYLYDHVRVLHEEGTNHTRYSATVLTTQYRVPLGNFMQGESFVAISRTGETMFFRGLAGSYLLGGNQIDLYLPDDRILFDIAGVMADAPQTKITQAFHDARHFLAQGEQVLIIKLDGLGWNMLEHAPFIQSLGPRQALAAYPPITPTGLAAMLTGKTGEQHGIQRRGIRTLEAEDIFEIAAQQGHATVFISTRTAHINTSLVPMLARDDADAFMLAQQALADQPDLLFVHFKGIDDTAHAHGPYAEQTQQTISEIDAFLQILVEQFDGRVIITSDHGLHETPDGGNHGLFLPEDMLVPYVIR